MNPTSGAQSGGYKTSYTRMEELESAGGGEERVEGLDTCVRRGIPGLTRYGGTGDNRDRWATTGGRECARGHRFRSIINFGGVADEDVASKAGDAVGDTFLGSARV